MPAGPHREPFSDEMAFISAAARAKAIITERRNIDRRLSAKDQITQDFTNSRSLKESVAREPRGVEDATYVRRAPDDSIVVW